jgi:hypothetical protein
LELYTDLDFLIILAILGGTLIKVIDAFAGIEAAQIIVVL